jgi:PrgI family protein
VNEQRIRLPADVEMEDRLAWGLTARQLVILVVTAIVCYAIFEAAGSLAPMPLPAVLGAPFALLGVGLALGRLDGLSGERVALAAGRQLTQPKLRVAAPDGMPEKLQGAPAQPAVALLRVPVKAILRSGVVELADGTSALLLAASGTSWALRSSEEQAALADAYGKWLNSLVAPCAITVRSELVDVAERAQVVERAALGLPHPALARCARDYAKFLASFAEGDGLRRRQILLVLSTRAREREAASADLERRASDAANLLRAAGVSLQPLDGEAATALLLGALEPPGPPAVSHLDGVIGRC